jgi:hypothetical protein
MSELKVNKVTPRSGTTITIGDSGEHLALAGNIGLGGATPTTSGTGISFPATQSASTDANTLDDYEEGTFTPTILGTTTAGTFTPSAAYTFARYTKIGRIVHIYFGLVYSSFTGTGGTKLGGLPFTSENFYAENTCSIQGTSLTKPANSAIIGVLLGNSTEVRVRTYDTSSATLSRTDLAVDAAAEIYFSLTYNV